MKRIQSIDFVRGLVMIIMTLDHTRDFLHLNPLGNEPTDLITTTPLLFFTRWITHLCAPTFVFLSGTSAYLTISKANNLVESRGFFFKRGLWLIFINFTINNFGIFFDVHFGVFFSQVIAVIGFGFIILGLLLSLSVNTIAIIGLIVIFGHNLFSGISFPNNQNLNIAWTYLMGVGYFQLTPNTGLLISYAILPWTAILLCGYGFGKIISESNNVSNKKMLFIGMGSLVAFFIIRYFNFYGDPSKWTFQKNEIFTFLSFLNTTKQPPSLLFVLMTLGISIQLLYLFQNTKNKIVKWVSVFGKVPLFYWLIHWYFLHFIAMGYYLIQGYKWQQLQFAGFGFGRPADGGGLPIVGVYIVWLAVVLALYPATRCYESYKMNNKNKWWLRYL